MNKIETLVRMVRAQVSDYKPEIDYSKQEKIPFSKLYSVASSGDKFLLYLGCVFAFCTGVFMPSMIIPFGEVINSFGEV
jgi:hypothetical protein